MRSGSAEIEAINAEIARLKGLGIDALRQSWRMMFGLAPPRGLTKDIMRGMIAYRIQEEAFGGLDRTRVKMLDRLAKGEKPREFDRRLKAGTVLIREYNGERHTVTVVPDGFLWQGKSWSSLSTIARAITGTPWNGPRFFGLRVTRGKTSRKEPEPSGPPPIDKPGRGGRSSVTAARRTNQSGGPKHGKIRQEAVPLRDLHPEIDRS